jgi:hypothetical protein
VPLLLCIAVTTATTYFLYVRTEQLFRASLNERMLSLASETSTHFDPAALDAITGHDSYESDAYRKIVLELQRIRKHTNALKFIYILRKTADPNTMAFVADAESLRPDVPEDINGDGKIDKGDQKTYPGDPYDVSTFPQFKNEAFLRPFVIRPYRRTKGGRICPGPRRSRTTAGPPRQPSTSWGSTWT